MSNRQTTPSPVRFPRYRVNRHLGLVTPRSEGSKVRSATLPARRAQEAARVRAAFDAAPVHRFSAPTRAIWERRCGELYFA